MQKDIVELKNELARKGKNPNSKRLLDGEINARKHAREVWQAQVDVRSSKTIKALSNTARILISAISTLFVLVLIIIGMVGGSLAVGWAEYEAVRVGFSTIDADHAKEYSLAIVGFFVTLLFIRQLISKQIERTHKPKFSIRLWLGNISYLLGIQKNWQVQYQQENMLLQIDVAIRVMMITVAIFGVMGRLSEIATKYASNKPMLAGLYDIVTKADLMDFFGFMGVFVMTLALLASQHFIVYFIYSVFNAVAGDVNVVENFTISSLEQAEEEAVRNYYENLLVSLENSDQIQ